MDVPEVEFKDSKSSLRKASIGIEMPQVEPVSEAKPHRKQRKFPLGIRVAGWPVVLKHQS
jgi:hypothetical protein